MAVSLIPKELHQRREQKSKISVAWLRQNILPIIAIVIFLGTSGVYGSLFLYERNLIGRNNEFKVQYDTIREQIDGEGRILASNFALRAGELLMIINQRNIPSKLFEFLEDTTHPDVTFSSFGFSFKSGEIRLGGSVRGYNELAEQILIWKGEPLISRVAVSEFTIDTSGNLKFTAILTLSEDVYAKS